MLLPTLPNGPGTVFPMRTTTIVFPFDQFGNSGTAQGAELLADVLREIVEDTKTEPRAVRAKTFAEQIKIKEYRFETMNALTGWHETGRQAARKALATGEFVIWLGGNHLSVLPLLEELPTDTLVIQCDAHLDIYKLQDCTTELSHGNFMRHAERLPTIVNVASRDLFLTTKPISRTFAEVYPVETMAANFQGVLDSLTARAEHASGVWLDIDVDAFDPLFLPAVCEPMPFGMTPMQCLALIQAIGARRLLGISLSEFAPGRDHRDASLHLLGWLIEWLLGWKSSGS